MKKIYDFIITLPARSLRKWGHWQIIPFLLLLLYGGWIVGKLDFSTDTALDLPENNSYRLQEEMFSKYFSTSDFIILSLSSENLYSQQTLDRIKLLSEELSRIEYGSSIISLATTNDLLVTEGELINIPLLAEEPDIDFIRSTIDKDPLFKHYLQSEDRLFWNIYLFPDEQGTFTNSELIETILTITEKSPLPVKLFGKRVVEYKLLKAVKRDFIILGSLAIIIILIIQLLYTKSLFSSLILLIGPLCAAFLTLSVMAFIHIPLTNITLVVPVIILSLSTSYNIHLYRYIIQDHILHLSLSHATPIILFTGLSTLMGFATLLFSSLEKLREFGAILMAGVILATTVTLFFLPALLSQKENKLHEKAAFRIPLVPARMLSLLIAGLIIFSLFLGAGIFKISYDYRQNTLFRPGSSIYEDSLFVSRHYGGLNEIELTIDSGEEYGLLNPELYHSIKRLQSTINSLNAVAKTISYIDFVDWLNKKMNSESDGAEEEIIDSEESIGENLEIITSNDTGLPIDALIDINYRYARILIRFGAPPGVSSRKAVTIYQSLKDTIATGCRENIPGYIYTLTGEAVKSETIIRELKNGQLISILTFLGALFLILLLRLRSLKQTAIVLIPGILAVLFFLGAAGWLQFPINLGSLLAVAIVMGVSVDDGIYFMLFYLHNKEAGTPAPVRATLRGSGKAIVQTTVVIICGLSVLLLSESYVLIRMGILIIGSFIFATTATLLLIPSFIRLLELAHKRKRKGETQCVIR